MRPDGSDIRRRTELGVRILEIGWSPNGKWIAFAGGGQLLAVGANGDVRLLADSTSPTHRGPTWSPDSQWVAFGAQPVPFVLPTLFKVSVDGGDMELMIDPPHFEWGGDWSPDGGQLVHEGWAPGNIMDIVVTTIETGERTNVTDHPFYETAPCWSPDGSKIVFMRQDVVNDLYVMGADGSGLEVLHQHPADDRSPSWSPDGTRIAFQSTRDGGDDIFTMTAEGDDPVNLTRHPAEDRYPSWWDRSLAVLPRQSRPVLWAGLKHPARFVWPPK